MYSCSYSRAHSTRQIVILYVNAEEQEVEASVGSRSSRAQPRSHGEADERGEGGAQAERRRWHQVAYACSLLPHLTSCLRAPEFLGLHLFHRNVNGLVTVLYTAPSCAHADHRRRAAQLRGRHGGRRRLRRERRHRHRHFDRDRVPRAAARVLYATLSFTRVRLDSTPRLDNLLNRFLTIACSGRHRADGGGRKLQDGAAAQHLHGLLGVRGSLHRHRSGVQRFSARLAPHDHPGHLHLRRPLRPRTPLVQYTEYSTTLCRGMCACQECTLYHSLTIITIHKPSHCARPNADARDDGGGGAH